MCQLSNDHVIVESLANAPRAVYVGGWYTDPGFETPDSRVAISVKGKISGSDQDFEAQVWITIPQLTSIVLAYFEVLLREKPFAKQLLKRLLGMRWALMTSVVYKDQPIAGDEWKVLRGQNSPELKG